MTSLPSSTAFFSRRCLLGAALAVLAAPAVPTRAQAQTTTYRELPWEALVPKGWDPTKGFEDLQDLAALPDADPRVQKLYERMRTVWDQAPTVAALAGKAVKMPGFVVPLETDKGGALREFLLVPYFGACIHTPPPPANQIIHVRADPPAKGLRSMDAVWVSGTLDVERAASDMGTSGYRLAAKKVSKYVEKR